MRCLAVVALLILPFAVGAGGVATLHVQVSGNGVVTSNPQGINCPSECSEEFDSGSRVVLTAHPAAGEAFLGWGGACSGSAETCITVADVEKNVAAKFTPGTLPAISIDDVVARETNVDIVAVLTATLAPASRETVTVHYATADGTAETTDYVADSGTLTFPPGTTSARIPVLIKGDALDEPDETILVDLSRPQHATIAKARGIVTIVDDDPAPVRIVDATVATRWDVHRTYTRVRRLVVSGVTEGASVEAACAGKGCPFRLKRTGPAVAPAFGKSKLRPGTIIEVRVSKPGWIAKVFRYTMRASNAPRAKTLCLPPAALKPTSC